MVTYLDSDPVWYARRSIDQVSAGQRTIEQMAARFVAFAEAECRGYAPFYEGLCEAVAVDSDILDIARQSNQGQPIPNLFLATVHYMLLADASHPLARHFSTIESKRDAAVEIFTAYRTFCLERRDSLVELLSVRRVQTNVVGRCAYLMPSFGMVSTHAERLPLALIDVGTSAGLNLNWDRYRYSYSNERQFGPSDSNVHLKSEVVGGRFPDLPHQYPEVACRKGIDLAPVNLLGPDALLWSRALIWPEHPQRARVFEAAASVLARNPPTLFAGDALDLLPGILETVPDHTVPCVFHCHTLNQFTSEARANFREIIERGSIDRAVYLVSAEGGTLVISRCNSGTWSVLARANCDPHGRWVEWL